MRRQRRKARQTMPKIDKKNSISISSVPLFENKENVSGIISSEILDEDDFERTELISKLNDATTQWKEEKNILPEKKENTFSKIIKKFSKKKQKDTKKYEDAIHFLNKIKNFNPADVEKINLDDLKQRNEPETILRHSRSIDGSKLDVKVTDKPEEKLEKIKPETIKFSEEVVNLTEEKEEREKNRKIKELHKKEINEAIKTQHRKEKIQEKNCKHLQIEISEINKSPEESKKIFQKEIKTTNIEKQESKASKIKQAVNENAFKIKKRIKQTLTLLKKQVIEKTEKPLKKYPDKFVKKRDGFKERSVFLKETKPEKEKEEKRNSKKYLIKKSSIQQIKPALKHIIKKNKIETEIENIYKEIEQV